MTFDIDEIIKQVYKSGEIAKKYQNLANISYELKKDKTPVSNADLEINNFFFNFLNKKFPGVKILSEEKNILSQREVIDTENFFIIDPIDGTSAFINKENFYTINLSYIHKNEPFFSIIYAPNINLMLYADYKKSYKIELGKNFIKKKEIYKNYKKDPSNHIKIITTKREKEILEIQSFLSNYEFSYELLHVSSSVKFCYLALDKADMYVRKARLKLWDVTAGFHIANNAGLNITDNNGDNIYKYFLSKRYIEEISDLNFKINEFIVSNFNFK